MQLRNRLKSIKKIMQTHHIDALFITQREDVFYYTGWKANEGNILIVNNQQRPTLFVSPLEQDAEKLKFANLVYLKRKEDILKELKGLKSVGYDEYNLTANRFSLLHKLPIRLKKSSELIKKPRQIKDSWEIEQIKKAVSVTKNSLEKQKIYGKTEDTIAANIEARFRSQCALTAFDTIVSSGSGVIHHQPRKIVVKSGKPVIIDFGARFNWYCCDVTRTLVKGNKEWSKIKENTLSIQKQIIDEIEPGIEMADIRKQYEKLMGKYGYKIQHSFGHGIGLDVHEQITGKLKEGMVMTVEPGVYKNNGGCRIEDTILVRKNGVEILTKQIKLD